MAGTTQKGAPRPNEDAPGSLEATMARLEEEHESVLRSRIPQMQAALHAAEAAQGARYGGVFRALREELARLWFEVEQHLRKEEEVLFPFIRDLEQGGTAPGLEGEAAVGDLEGLRHEHETACDRLSRIRRLTGGYALPPDASRPMQELYMGLKDLEDALRCHIELEDNVLVPRAMALAQRPRRD